MKDRGSAVLEGAVALAVAFVLLSLIVQAGMAVTAQQAAETATAAIARRAARDGADLPAEAQALDQLLRSTVPGARTFTTSIEVRSELVIASAEFEWDPPGPRWAPLRFSVSAAAPLMSPP